MSRRLTDLQLERFLADALSVGEKTAVEAALRQSPDDAEALRLLRADDAASLLRLPPAAFVERVMPSKPSRSIGAWWLAVAAMVAAVLTLVVVRPSGVDDETGVKGTVGWKVTATGPSGTRTLSARDAVTAGETLSFQVTAAKPTWVAVISHAPDGWFVYAPGSQVGAGKSVLGQAAKLDDTKGDETLYLVTADAPFDANQLVERLKNSAADPSVALESLPLVKR